MKDKLYQAFVDATHNVYRMMLSISEISEHPADYFNCEEEIDISIGVVGDLKGEVVYRFPVSTSLKMVNIMSGMQFDQVDAFVTSAIAEIANIVSGNVLSALSDHEFECDILPPVQCQLDTNKEYEVKTSCCFETAIGEICLEVRLNRAA